MDDKYYYVLVDYEDANKAGYFYWYKSDDFNIKKGDRVVVERNGEIASAQVVETRICDFDNVPYSIDETKSIIRVLEPDEIFNEGIEEEKYYITLFDEYDGEENDDEISEEELEEMQVKKYHEKEYIVNNILNSIRVDGVLNSKFNLNWTSPSEEDEDTEGVYEFIINMFDSLDIGHIDMIVEITDRFFHAKPNRVIATNFILIVDYIYKIEDKRKINLIAEYAAQLFYKARTVEGVRLALIIFSVIDPEEDVIFSHILSVGMCKEFIKEVNLIINIYFNDNKVIADKLKLYLSRKREEGKKYNIFDATIDDEIFNYISLMTGRYLYDNYEIVSLEYDNNIYKIETARGKEYNSDRVTNIYCDSDNNIERISCGCSKNNCEHAYAGILKIREKYGNEKR